MPERKPKISKKAGSENRTENQQQTGEGVEADGNYAEPENAPLPDVSEEEIDSLSTVGSESPSDEEQPENIDEDIELNDLVARMQRLGYTVITSMDDDTASMLAENDDSQAQPGANHPTPPWTDETPDWSDDEWTLAMQTIQNTRTGMILPTLAPGHHWEMVSDDVREVVRDVESGQFASPDADTTTITQHFPAHREVVEIAPVTAPSIPEVREPYDNNETLAGVIEDLISELRYHLDVFPKGTAAVVERGTKYAEFLRQQNQRTDALAISMLEALDKVVIKVAAGHYTLDQPVADNPVGEASDYTSDEDDTP